MATAPSRLTGRIFAFTAAGIVLYVVIAALTGWGDLRSELARMPLRWVPPLLLLSGVNYGLRFWRWHLYLRRLGIAVPAGESAAVFFGTFLMVVTPGKVGEAFKAGLLRQRRRAPLSLGLPVLAAERLFDLLAILLLALGGLLTWQGPASRFQGGLAAAALIAAVPFALRSRRLRRRLLRWLERLASRMAGRLNLAQALEATGRLLDLRVSAVSLLLSLVAWAAEALELYIVCRALGAPIGLTAGLFIYATGTVAGSLSFLPGGLGGTEAVMFWLLDATGVPADAAVAATLIVRAATLWLAVLVGLVVYVLCRRLLAAPAPGDRPSPPSGPPRTGSVSWS